MDLQTIIDSGDPREIKRAMSVRMLSENLSPKVIEKLLGIGQSFISKFKKIYASKGASGLKLGYQGSKSYLSVGAKAEIIAYIKSVQLIDLQILVKYIKEKYNIEFKSKQSYYTLLDLGGKTYHKTKKINPKKNEAKVQEKRAEIKKNRTITGIDKKR